MFTQWPELCPNCVVYPGMSCQKSKRQTELYGDHFFLSDEDVGCDPLCGNFRPISSRGFVLYLSIIAKWWNIAKGKRGKINQNVETLGYPSGYFCYSHRWLNRRLTNLKSAFQKEFPLYFSIVLFCNSSSDLTKLKTKVWEKPFLCFNLGYLVLVRFLYLAGMYYYYFVTS